jgi:hypothetical protein
MTYIERQPSPDFKRKSDVQLRNEHLESNGEVGIVLISRPVRHVPGLRNAEKIKAIGFAHGSETTEDIFGIQLTADEVASDVNVSQAIFGEERRVDFVRLRQVVWIDEGVVEICGQLV